MIKPEFYKPEIHIKGWGREEWLVNNDKYCGKILKINKGAKFSLHFHLSKQETFYFLNTAIFRYMDLEKAEQITKIIQKGECIDIPIGLPHQIEAIEDIEIIEISTHHEDEDSYRIGKGDSQK